LSYSGCRAWPATPEPTDPSFPPRLDDLHDRLLTVERGTCAEIIFTALSFPVGRTGADGSPG